MSTNRNNNKQRNRQRSTPSVTAWRSPSPDFDPSEYRTTALPAASGPDTRELFAVVNSDGIQALYCWKEDALAHAKVCAGKVQTVRVLYELPAWVKVMVDHAVDQAAMQNKTTIH